MTKLIVGLAAALAGASEATGSWRLHEQRSDRKLNLLLAAVVAALIAMALVMPGEW